MDDNKKFWERVARLYTPLQERSNRELYRQVYERCRRHLNTEDQVLELACGTGQFTFALCPSVHSWEATDFSAKMVHELSKRIPEDLKTKIKVSVQDATSLPYEDSSFDVVFIANALHIMPEPEKALSEIRRVLKPGGRLIAPTFVYEGKMNKVRLWLLDKAGFKTFNRWSLDGLVDFLARNGFETTASDTIAGKLLPEGLVVCRGKRRHELKDVTNTEVS